MPLMKLISLYLFSLFFVLTPSEDEVKMTWDENKKLTWADFQGEPKPGSGFVASTNSGISFSYSFKTLNGDVEYSFTVHSYFYPESSWYLRSQVNDHILAHEQTHFDITELFARILRARIEATPFSEKIKEEIEKIYRQTETKRKEMQERFDRESNHSKNKSGEKVWEDFVAEKLEEYERWK